MGAVRDADSWLAGGWTQDLPRHALATVASASPTAVAEAVLAYFHGSGCDALVRGGCARALCETQTAGWPVGGQLLRTSHPTFWRVPGKIVSQLTGFPNLRCL